MKKTWFTGCQHYGHNNIIELCNRPFMDIIEHDNQLILNHNSSISNNDICYFLGDLSYRCSAEYTYKIIKKLNFEKAYFIFGNHCKPLRQAIQMGFLDKDLNSGRIEIVGGQSAIDDKTISISKMIEINGQRIFLSHYPYHSWPNSFRSSWMLHSHCHNKVKSPYKRMDVGVDGHNFYPWSFEDIKIKIDAITNEFSEKG